VSSHVFFSVGEKTYISNEKQTILENFLYFLKEDLSTHMLCVIEI